MSHQPCQHARLSYTPKLLADHTKREADETSNGFREIRTFSGITIKRPISRNRRPLELKALRASVTSTGAYNYSQATRKPVTSVASCAKLYSDDKSLVKFRPLGRDTLFQ